jgi:serine/threonine protein kinase
MESAANITIELNKDKPQVIDKNCGLIDNTYLCFKNYVIGSGSFGKVLYGMHVNRQSEYAIKFEKMTVKNSVLLEELKIYNHLKGGEGIPRIYYYGKYRDYKVMVMDLLGPSLDKFFKICNKKLSLETTLNFGEQMISRIEYVHSKNYLHRDIKPNNFNLGSYSRKFNDNTVYIVDFGLSKEYVDLDTKQHYEYKEGRSFVGTPRYASINTHIGIRQSRRDDLESIIYVLIYFMKGELPWQGIRAKTKSEKKEKIKQTKKYTTSEELCVNLPPEFAFLLTYTKNLKFDEKPDYNHMRYQISKMKTANNLTLNINDVNWEWDTLFIQARQNKKNYMVLKKQYEKLYDGYPLVNFEEYLNMLSGEQTDEEVTNNGKKGKKTKSNMFTIQKSSITKDTNIIKLENIPLNNNLGSYNFLTENNNININIKNDIFVVASDIINKETQSKANNKPIKITDIFNLDKK